MKSELEDALCIEDDEPQCTQNEQIQASPKKNLEVFIKSTVTNLTYKLKSICKYRQTVVMKQCYTQASLMGVYYSYSERQQLQRAIQSLIWCSYRSEDIGWGCMIRVVQMVLAEAIRRNGHLLPREQIIALFRSKGQFSLQHICQEGGIKQRWTSCPQVLSIVSTLYTRVKDKHSFTFHLDMVSSLFDLAPYSFYTPQHFPKLITILCGEGKEHLQQEYQQHLLALIRLKHFAGMVVGQGKRALYAVGEYQGKVIIFDPHYVQHNEEQQAFCQREPYGIHPTELCATVAINYYIPDLEQFREWAYDLVRLDKVCAPSVLFNLSIQDDRWREIGRKFSDDFQLI